MASITDRPGFVPPPVPVRPPRPVQAARRATRRRTGRPLDRHPDAIRHRDAVIAALGASDAERGYPPSIGSLDLRTAVAAVDRPPLRRRRPGRSDRRVRRHQGVRRDAAAMAAPQATRPRHRAVPGRRLPDVRDGCDPGRLPGGSGAAERRRFARPRQPSRRPTPVAHWRCGSTARAIPPVRSTTWRRPPRGVGRHDVPVFSDECYVEFTWSDRGRTILEHGLEGVVAVHSLSKRSNLAGVRIGFYAGDAELVHYLQEVRKHVGLMVPGPAAGGGRRSARGRRPCRRPARAVHAPPRTSC